MSIQVPSGHTVKRAPGLVPPRVCIDKAVEEVQTKMHRLASSALRSRCAPVNPHRTAAKHRNLQLTRSFAVHSFEGHAPKISDKVGFVAPSADLVGRVTVDEDASIWYNCTLRADVNTISVGRGSNIQDGTVIHCRSGELGGEPNPTTIGEDVTVGHSCLLHACTLKDRSFVGMQACVMDFAVVEEGAMVAAGALVPMGKVVKAGELWAGRPAKKVRDLTEKELEFVKVKSPKEYAGFARRHREGTKEVET